MDAVERAQQYRLQAAEYRKQAADVRDPAQRKHLEGLAVSYDQLAQQAMALDSLKDELDAITSNSDKPPKTN